MVNQNEEIAVGCLGGAFVPALFQRYQSGEQKTAGLKELPGPLSKKPVQAGTFAGIGGIVLGVLGAKNRGPFARNPSAVAMSTAFGAASLGTTLTYAMYPVEERAEAAGLMGAPAGGEVKTGAETSAPTPPTPGETTSSTTSTETESEEEETTLGSVGFK